MKRKPSPAGRVLDLALWLFAGALVAMYFDPPLIVIVEFLAWLVAIQLLVTVVHELGHWLAGRLAGFRTMRFSVGPLNWLVVNGRIRFRASCRRGMPAGATQMFYDGEDAVERRYMVFIAGGPVMSLTTAALAAALALSLSGGGLRFVLFLYAWLSAFAGIINLLPVRFGAFSSDGLQLLTLLRGGQEARHMLAVFRLSTLLYAGVRPRDWPREIVAVLDEGEPSPAQRNALHAMQFLCLRDREETETARRVLEAELEALQQENSQLEANWRLEGAFFYAQVDGDGVKAREHFTRGANAVYVDEVVRHMIEAEVLLAERRVQEAEQALVRAIATRENIVYTPPGIPMAEALQDLEQRLRKTAAAEERNVLSRVV